MTDRGRWGVSQRLAGGVLVAAAIAIGLASGPVRGGESGAAGKVLERIRAFNFTPNDSYHGIADLNDQAWRVRTRVVRDLIRMGPKIGPELIGFLKDDNRHVRDVSSMVLGILNVEEAGEGLQRLAVGDPAPVVRVEAIEALSKIGGKGVKEFIEARKVKDPHRDVRNRCVVALGRLERGMTVSHDLAKAYASLAESDFRRAKVGQSAPDFILKDTTGKSWKLSDFKGKNPVALIWIFAEWCPVCLGEFHDLKQIEEKFKKAGVKVMTVECHDLYRCQAMVGKRKTWWPHLVDLAGKVGLRYGVDHMEFTVHSDWINRPATFIIDRKGILKFAYYGTFWGDRPTIRETLEMIVKENYVFEHPERRKKP